MRFDARGLAPLLGILVSGCAMLGGQPEAPEQTPAEQEAQIRARYGDQMMEDVNALKALGKGPQTSGVASCLKIYGQAVDMEKRAQEDANPKRLESGVAQQYRACASSCGEHHLPTATADAARPIAARYEALCKERSGKIDSVGHIQRFRVAMDRLSTTTGALNIRQVMGEARGALKQAIEGAGASAFEAEAQEFQAAEAKHKEAEEKASAFLQRPDVKELEARRRTLMAQIADYERLGMKAQAEKAKGDLRGVEAKWSLLVREAGL
ncbi:hypothetical protein [Polyangium mundeleinium]|uniref:Lipoprotein n=1 Tax=Polyangium mundeleinium TaxID=2995306 RepID=A0ABT5F631_9BACT|nr:hypothetical protein [Polyangium mundeleinium]MDC0748556.1 hypothetical protein [Polyangium mundeleinium]